MWRENNVKPIVIQKNLQEFCNRSLLISTRNNIFQFESLVHRFILQQINILTDAHEQAIKYYQTNCKDRESWEILEDVSEYLEIAHHNYELKLYSSSNYWIALCASFLNSSGYYAILIEVYEKLITGWQFSLNPGEYSHFANILDRLGIFYRMFGQIESSISYHEKAIEIYWKTKDLDGVANCLGNLGNLFDSIEKHNQAIYLYNQSLEIHRKIGDLSGQAKSLGNLGTICISLKEYQHAITLFEWSLELQQQIEDLNGQAKSLCNLGTINIIIKNYEEAIGFYKQSLEIKQQTKDLHGQASAYLNLGTCYYCLKKYKTAMGYYQKSLNIEQKICNANKIDSSDIALSSIIGLANTYYSLRKYENAIYLRKKSIKINQQIKNTEGEAIAWFWLGNTYKNLYQKPEAKKTYEMARELYQSIELEKHTKACDRAIQELENQDKEPD